MSRYYVIDVSLKGVKPRIWRRFMISAEASYVDLHEAIQDACGWRNCHLFRFLDTKSRVLAELPGDEDEEKGPDARAIPIALDLGLKKGKKLFYVYDFGDWWEHDVQMVDVDKDWPEEFGRRLLAGERAFTARGLWRDRRLRRVRRSRRAGIQRTIEIYFGCQKYRLKKVTRNVSSHLAHIPGPPFGPSNILPGPTSTEGHSGQSAQGTKKKNQNSVAIRRPSPE